MLYKKEKLVRKADHLLKQATFFLFYFLLPSSLALFSFFSIFLGDYGGVDEMEGKLLLNGEKKKKKSKNLNQLLLILDDK